MFDSLDISASALLAQRTRMDTIAGNIANMNTTRNARGEPVPYRRRFAVFATGRPDAPNKAGVSVSKIQIDSSPFRKEYQPNHPDANKDGYVSYPNIDLAVEYVNALEASRAYEANVTAMEVSKAMMNASLRLLA
ncbi:MAG TPA: flagellar basal body rod protein FlgC [Tepidisphaeraceae bacterium]|jgi:flagellar basal-body rod protein FlgC|nr:flagellar basal body rod protein FlgC [Tepidisphaeraceae bacterium]